MKGVSTLKRKIDQIREEERVLVSELHALQERLCDYLQREFEAFVMSRCKRVTGFFQYPEVTFDNGLKARIFRDSCSVKVCDSAGRQLGEFRPRRDGGFSPHVPSSQVFRSDRPKEHAERIALLVDMTPEFWLLADKVLPAWLEESENLDMESLMTARVLRWIAAELPGVWPDIVEGNFPIK